MFSGAGEPPTRTRATESSYRNTTDSLRHMAEGEARAGGDLFELVSWFCSQHERWSASTVRQYRAALCYVIDTAPQMHPAQREILRLRLSRGPVPRNAGPRRTSARKRKSLSKREWTLLFNAVGKSTAPDDLLLLAFLGFGPVLFLRPSEYLDSRIEGTLLITRNAKATNGRANGKDRVRQLEMPQPMLAYLESFLKALLEAADVAGSRRLFNRLSARLSRICAACKVSRVSLYTLRHVGIASAKLWMTPIEVAASAGHASTRTATSHYAKRRSGWSGIRFGGRPTAASIAAVREVGRQTFESSLNQLRP